MQKCVLAYNFTPERLSALRLLCMMLKAQLRPVAREELMQPVGYFAGVPGVEPSAESYAGDEAREEMLVMCGFMRSDLDRLLAAIRKSRLQSVKLKAMLTQHNALWSGVELQKELAQEHEYMNSKGER